MCPELTSKWNVKVLNLHRHKRHQDVSVQNEFWNDLGEFLRKEKFNGIDLEKNYKDKNPSEGLADKREKVPVRGFGRGFR